MLIMYYYIFKFGPKLNHVGTLLQQVKGSPSTSTAFLYTCAEHHASSMRFRRGTQAVGKRSVSYMLRPMPWSTDAMTLMSP